MFKSRPGKYGALCIMFNDLNASSQATLGHYCINLITNEPRPAARADQASAVFARRRGQPCEPADQIEYKRSINRSL